MSRDLDAAQIDSNKVIEWLSQKWKSPTTCPICKSNNWNVSQRLIEVREFHGGSLVLGGPVYPLVSVTCTVCGHTLLFNAVVAGLLPMEKTTKPESDKGEHKE